MKDFPWGYLVGAAVTVIGLLVNQWRADRRETDRWQKEVDRDQLKWQHEQDERLQQWKREDSRRWIEDQRAHYADSLRTGQAFLDGLHELSILLAEAQTAEKVDEQIRSSENRLDGLQDAFSAAATEVVIIATDPVLDPVDDLRSHLRSAYYVARYSLIYAVGELESELRDAEKAYAAYFSAVREELGIASPSPAATPAPFP